MKTIISLFVLIFLAACMKETNHYEALSLGWIKHETDITTEPNYHFMLKGSDRDFCIVSISDVIFSDRKPLHATQPAMKTADIDCSFGGISYAIHPDSHTFITVESMDTPDSPQYFRLQARLSNDDNTEAASLYQTVSLRLNNE